MIGLGWLYGLDLEMEANEREDHTLEILHEVVETPETKQILISLWKKSVNYYYF